MALGFINRSFYNGKGLGRFRSKQIGCNKRLDLLTVDLLTEFHCIGIFLSGYCTMQRHRLYWATESDIYNKMVTTTMHQNRFEEIMAFFIMQLLLIC